MKQTLLLIGNGMVGQRFLELWVETPESADWTTVCLAEETLPAYDRVHLSSYFETRKASDLALVDEFWYDRNNVVLSLGDPARSLDTTAKTCTTASGKVIDYDIAVFATGSTPFLPPLAGIDRTGVFLYRTIDDLDRMLAHSHKARRAAVIGGGLLGLEAAKALTDLKMKTTVIEHSSRLMNRQIDQGGSDVVAKKLDSIGVDVLTGKQARALTGDTAVDGIEFSDGTNLSVQMVVISAGIRPRDELAQKAGMAVHERGGIIVNEKMQTSAANVYAIGECALASGMIWGLVAPGYRMAETAVKNITKSAQATFTGSDMSTKLKLMGIDVASIGHAVPNPETTEEVLLVDTQAGVYKKLFINRESRRISGAILVGDASDYSQILQLYLNKMDIPEKPETLLVKGGGGFQIGVDALPDEAVICSCNNVSKGSIAGFVRNGVYDLSELKSCSKAGTSCGSCAGMVKDLLNLEKEKAGIVVDNSLCEHFAHTRQELYEIVQIKQIKTFADLLASSGKGRGCEICKPTAASIFASLWHENAQAQPQLQDTNDYYMANIQKNGTYSIVPRVPGGEITPDQLIAIGTVAKEFSLYTKITGAQRVDLFGARVEDLPKIWAQLVQAGLESGQAYAKALRAVKSCVGSTWCRFGVQDSTTLAIDLEKRYRGLRSPHKLKFGVSGCARECAEARGKDVGVIATKAGWNLYVCGNGGMNPKHAVLLAQDLDRATLIRYIDRFLIYYIRTADRLTRTAPWLEGLKGGIERLKEVVINDSLGIASDMEAEMAKAVLDYECEWTATLNDPEKLKRFRPFVNADSPDSNIQFVDVRGQVQPVLQGVK